MIIAIIAALLAANPMPATSTITVNGMDGIVTMHDSVGNTMTVPADCARVITDSGAIYLTDILTNGVTATPDYIKACF